MSDVRYVPNGRGGGRLQTMFAVGAVVGLSQGEYVKVSGRRWELVVNREVTMADSTVARLLIEAMF